MALYKDFRRGITPKIVDSIPDYTGPTMAKAYDSLQTLLATWKGMDTTGWTIDQRIDYRLVGAQLHGEDFNHRIIKRWSSDPAFYNTIRLVQSYHGRRGIAAQAITHGAGTAEAV